MGLEDGRPLGGIAGETLIGGAGRRRDTVLKDSAMDGWMEGMESIEACG